MPLEGSYCLWLEGRDDRLTDASTAWAVRKGQLQPKLLLQRMTKITAKLVTARANLEKECMSLLGASPAMCTATILSLIDQVKEMAAGGGQHSHQALYCLAGSTE